MSCIVALQTYSTNRSWFPGKKTLLVILLLISTLGVVLLTKYTRNGPSLSDHAASFQSPIGQRQNQISDLKLISQGGKPKTWSQHRNGTQNHFGFTLEKVSRVLVEPKTAHVTYDVNEIVQCPDSSPYIFCAGRPAPRSKSDQAADSARHSPWKFSIARSLGWTSPVDFSSCSYNNCIDVGPQPLSDTDVVGFNAVQLFDSYPRPVRKIGSNQRWALMVWESPAHSLASFQRDDKSIWNREINMTFTYRTDSDVFVSYGLLAFEPQPLHKRPNYYDIASKKTKLVAWFVSNCNTQSRRLQYVEKMKEYIEVDIVGACGIPCPRGMHMCEDGLLEKYKFYLSFENSLCTDYVTEKFFKVYRDNIHVIPVTRGGAHYSKYFPANTFVNAADFASPRQLAEHLKVLASDNKRFAQMLELKDMYRWFGGHSQMWCSLCEVLNTKGFTRKTINLKQWWSDGHCYEPTDIR